jgi:hypothetical protein
MPFWYNAASEGSKFNSLACTDWNQVNSMVQFDELAVKSDEEFHHLFGHANSATDVIKVGEKDFKWIPQLVTIKIARKNYQKYDRVAKKKVDAEQSTIEKLICKLLESYDLSKVWKANIQFQHSNIVQMLVDGVDTMGKPMPDMVFDSMSSSYLSMSEVTEPQHIKPDELQLPKAGNWSGGKASQTEYEKISDRMKFATEQIKLAFPTVEATSVFDIANSLEKVPGLASVWDIITQFFK